VIVNRSGDSRLKRFAAGSFVAFSWRAVRGHEALVMDTRTNDCSSAVADVGDQSRERLQRGGQQT